MANSTSKSAVWFDPELLWEVATEFQHWKYRFALWNPPALSVPPEPSYPLSFLEHAKTKGLGGDKSLFAGLNLESCKQKTLNGPSTNCSMFVEAVIIGAAMRTTPGKVDWNLDSHNQVMAAVAGADPIAAYVAAGMAEECRPEDPPSPWTVCQGFAKPDASHPKGSGHAFFILDYDSNSRRCLTLEANTFVLNQPEEGFVGHRGIFDKGQTKAWGRPIGPIPPAGWAGLEVPKWDDIKKRYNLSFKCARLRLRVPNRFCAPLSRPGVPSNPVQAYLNNEDPATGVGGTYCLGDNRMLHGGIHLFPAEGAASTPVRCMAPGYIVAARLPPPGTPPATPKVFGVTNNWTGFVLVRHEIEKVEEASGAETSGAASPPKSDSIYLYSLYMHLSPPNYSSLETDPYLAMPASVPWFAELARKRHGSWIRVAADGQPEPGTVFWSAEPFSGFDKPYKVHDHPNPIRPKAPNGKLEWVFKHPPLGINKIFEELGKGKVVTFPEPFVPIPTAGENVGFVRRLDPGTCKPIPPEGVSPPDIKQSGFIHWEVFAPFTRGSSDLGRLLDLAKQAIPELKELLAKEPVREISDDNFLEVQELREKVLPALTGAEQALLKPGVDALELFDKEAREKKDTVPVRLLAAHRSSLRALLRDKASFAVQNGYDGKSPPAGFTYPLALDLESESLPPPEQSADGASYTLGVEYLGPGSDGKQATLATDTLELTQAKFNEKSDQRGKYVRLWLKVPAGADAVRLSSPSGDLLLGRAGSDPGDSSALLLKCLLPARFRGTRLTHFNEWSPGGAQNL